MAWAATHTFSVGEVVTSANMNLIQNNINAANPVGALKYVVGATAGNATANVWQNGWLECNAAQVSRATYASLYSYLNGLSPALPFGTGDGSTTFHLPDLQGRYPVHHTTGGHADVGTLGNTEGVTFDKRRPKHRTTDGITVTSSLGISDPSHNHGWKQQTGLGPPNNYNSGDGYRGGNSVASYAVETDVNVAATTGITLSGAQASRSGSIGTNNTNDALDTAPYLVAGIWVVKF